MATNECYDDKMIGPIHVEISADDILSCCTKGGWGCRGGWTTSAWDFFVKEGAVTGGNYGSKDCCRPYEIPTCGWHKGEPHYKCRELYKGGTPACKKECQPGYNKNYTMDKYYGAIPPIRESAMDKSEECKKKYLHDAFI
ncbi:papain family cysteine protease [Teladorsagia circumcincta]|uniref:Papain family cysteine protease n=1 Tax=Teladorsagia circumcincta TaxID=45464 RepID=A0A2G9ULB3_TELCI|nr:papain family cysteine protease [Teladorsagia circumcincta]